MKILTTVGTRPNFMKIAPIHRAFYDHPSIESKLIHTGQHYDTQLSDVFFRQLGLPTPAYYLNVCAGTPTQQSVDIILKFKKILRSEQPDWVVVVGDVTSTLACALAAAQLGIRIAHVEAGLRSNDRQMPEENNRIQTDALADLLFVTEQAGIDNLRQEGIADRKIHFVGNVMIDSLVEFRAKANALNAVATLGLSPNTYVLVTMHRPSNVDTMAGLHRILKVVEKVARQKTVVFSLHPRTKASLIRHGLLPRLASIPNLRLLEPQGYLEFLNLLEHATAVITDSGGVQEETTFLQTPCLTFRTTTERPVTVEMGTNQLLSDLRPERVEEELNAILEGRYKIGKIPPLWDGHAAQRIAHILSQHP